MTWRYFGSGYRDEAPRRWRENTISVLDKCVNHGHNGPFLDGASGTRTRDLLGAIQALSQLSYSPAWAAGMTRRHGQG